MPYSVCISKCPSGTETEVPCMGTSNVPAVNGMCTPEPGPYTTINFLNKYCVPNVADLPIAQ
ncbi:MAG: hypothetical protein ACK521_09325 [bacterium]